MTEKITNAELERALEYMRNGENVFLAGAGGTGKTHLFQTFAKECRDQGKVVCRIAFMGLASRNIGGMTAHSLFGLDNKGNAKEKLIDSMDVLIVDEISVLKKGYFDEIIDRLEDTEKRLGKKIQIIIAGDFLQLGIFTPKKGNNGKSGPAYRSKAWWKKRIKVVYLDKVIRQQDEEFAKSLNLIRTGHYEGIFYINAHKSRVPLPNAIWICPNNKSVDKKNEEMLAQLDGKEKVYKTITDCKYSSNYDDKEKDIVLKIGARVMATYNNTKAGYVNGDIGTVIKLYEHSVVVDFDEAGVIEVHRRKKSVGKMMHNGVAFAAGNQSYIPLKLAFAITVHKAEGLTLEAVNIDLAGKSMFASGQLYTALSRVTSVEKLYINRDIVGEDLIVSEEALRMDKLWQELSREERTMSYDCLERGLSVAS